MSKKLNEPLLKVIQGGLSTIEGVIKGKDDLFNSNLPTGLTPEIVDQVVDYTTDFVAAGTQALGVAAVDALKADKKLETVSGEIGLGAMGKLETSTARETETEIGEVKSTSFGSTRPKVTFQPGVNAGSLKIAKRTIKEYAQEVLGAKK